MASYWVGGSGTWNASDTTHWASSSGGAGGQSVPTATDDVVFDTASNATGYTVTISATANTLSCNIGAPASGVVTLAGGNTINARGSLTFHSGLVNTWTGTTLLSPATAVTAVLTSNGVAMGTLQKGNQGGTLQLGDNLTINGAGTIANPCLEKNTQGVFDANGKTVTLTAPSPFISANFTGTSAFYNLTKTGTAAKTNKLSLLGDLTCTNAFTVTGQSDLNRVLIASNRNNNTSGRGVPTTITAAVVAITRSDLEDIVGAGAGDWNLSAVTGLSGDCGGNSGITFTTGVTNYWVGNTGNWDDINEWGSSSGAAGATGRVPLPQDDVVFDNNSFNGNTQTVAFNGMPRVGRNVDLSAFNEVYGNKPSFTGTGQDISIFGSFIGSSFMQVSANSATWTFEGRSTYSLTSNGFNFNTKTVVFDAPGATYTITDAFTNTVVMTFTQGTLTAQNNVTVATFNSSNSNTRVLNMGSGTWNLTNTAVASNPWNLATSTGLTLNKDTSTILINGSTVNVRTFNGGGMTYNILQYTNATANGFLHFTGSNTFTTFAYTGTNAQSIKFTLSTTNTFTNFNVTGSSGNVVTLDTVSGTGTATLAKAGGGVVSMDYMNITRIVGSPTLTFYAGANSTDGGTNTAVYFTVPPSGASSVAMMHHMQIAGGLM